MTLPNKLTMFRIILIPVMIVIYYIPYFRETLVIEGEIGFYYGINLSMFINFFVFFVASITDFFDGYIARKKGLVTTFGKFADPLADKMLVFTAMVIFMLDNRPVASWAKDLPNFIQNMMPLWAFIIILLREFAVSGIRMMAASKGKVIPAAKMGKYKTATTMLALLFMFFAHTCIAVDVIGRSLMAIALVLTVVSGIEYFINSKDIILESV